ncbi:MAG: type III-A CRISPR-associated protein Csm2 [Saprospiraceae bacterium]
MNGQHQQRPKQYPQNQNERPAAKNWANEIKQDWMTLCLTDEAVFFAEKFSKHLVTDNPNSKDALTTNQIRNFFGEVRKIQMGGFEKNKGSFVMLKPRLAFAKVRAMKEAKGSRFVDFEQVILELMKNVSEEKHFQNFADMLEAIVAFHRANNGK